MKKWQVVDYILAGIFVLAVLVYLGILFFNGNSVNQMLTFFLYVAAGISIQILFLHVMNWKAIKVLPLVATVLFAIWCIWLYGTSLDWKNATMEDLIVDCISPMIGCLLACSTYNMKNRLALWTTLSVAVMLLFPGLTVAFIKSDAAMVVCLLLFFAVNPLYSVTAGIFAGRKIKEMWGLPIISSVLFLLGTWIFFDMGERAFVLYAAVYLVIGLIAMLVSLVMNERKKKAAEPKRVQEEMQEEA